MNATKIVKTIKIRGVDVPVYAAAAQKTCLIEKILNFDSLKYVPALALLVITGFIAATYAIIG